MLSTTAITSAGTPAVWVGSKNTLNAAGTGTVGRFIDGTDNTSAFWPVFGKTYEYTVRARAGNVNNPTATSAHTAGLQVKVGSTGNAFGAVTPTLGAINAIRMATAGANRDTDTVILDWTEEATNSNTSYTVQYRMCAVASATATSCRYPTTDARYWGPWTTAALGAAGGAANSTGASFKVTRQTLHANGGRPAQFQIRAQNSIGNGGWSTPATDILLP